MNSIVKGTMKCRNMAVFKCVGGQLSKSGLKLFSAEIQGVVGNVFLLFLEGFEQYNDFVKATLTGNQESISTQVANL